MVQRTARASVATLLLVGSASCATTTHAPLPDPAAIPAARTGPGRILLEETVLRFSLGIDGRPIVEESALRQAVVDGERGQWLRTLHLMYSETFQTVGAVAVSARFPDGTEKSWGRETARDLPATPGLVLYTDERILSIAPPAVPRGSVVASRSSMTMRSPELFSWQQTFGSEVPVDRVRLVVEVPVGFRVEHIAERGLVVIDLPPTVEVLPDGGQRLTWQRTGIVDKREIPRGYSMSAQHERVWLRLAEWPGPDGKPARGPTDDRSTSRFTHELLRGTDAADATLTATVKRVLADAPADQRRRAARLYSWVRDHIRYCAIHVGMGGWVPHHARQVHEVRYGDCKDKANLLRTMLKADGIDSRIAVLFAGDWPHRFRLPVLVGNFNHAILIVDLPDGPVMVDPTSRTTPFADLPDADEDRQLLPLTADGAPLTASGSSSPAVDVRDESYQLTLGDDGTVSGTFTSSMNGAYADDTRYQLLSAPADRQDEIAEHAIAFWLPEVEAVRFDNAEPPEELTPVVATGTMNKRLVRGGLNAGDVVVRASDLIGASFPTVQRQENGAPRVGPFLLGHRRTDRVAFAIKLPASMRAARLPDAVVLTSPFGSYRRAWRASDDGHTLFLEREAVVTARVIAEAEVDALRAFVEQATLADEAPVAIVAAEGP